MDNSKSITKIMSSQAGLLLRRPTPETSEIYAFLLARPFAWTLLCQIVLRANHEGKAMIGDFKNMGMTEQNYRTAKAQLEKMKLVEFPRRTNRGTVAKLMKSDIWAAINLPNSPHKKMEDDEAKKISKEGEELLRLLELFPPPNYTNLKAFLFKKRKDLLEKGLSDLDRADLERLTKKEEEMKRDELAARKSEERKQEEARVEAEKAARLKQLEDEGYEIYLNMNELEREKINRIAAVDADKGSLRWRTIVAQVALKSRPVEQVGGIIGQVLQKVG
ncbi:MAG: hypothetical protein ACYCYJ_07905 [Trichloromonadaceae bacterium]